MEGCRTAIKDDFTTTINFKHDILLYAQKNWPEIACKFNEMFHLNPPLPTDDDASFDFSLAILFIESRAPYNIYSNEQGERIWTYLKNSFAVEPHYGGYANESLDYYSTVWDHYIDKSVNPLGGITAVLLKKLGHKVSDSDIIFGTVVMDTLALSPPWWKNFSKNNELVKSDIPVNLDAYKKWVTASSDSLKEQPRTEQRWWEFWKS